MGILDNLENAWDEEFSFDRKTQEFDNLSQKLFSDLVCKECESKPIVETDAMGREKFWEDLGRPETSGELKMSSSCECNGCTCSD